MPHPVGTTLRRPLAATLVALLGPLTLAGCTSGEDAASTDGDGPPVEGLAASPRTPHLDGPVEVSLRAGLRVLSDDPCGTEGPQEAVCTKDGARGWVPYAAARGVRLLAAEPRQDAARSSWSLVLRFAPPAADDLRATVAGARSVGGEVLVVQDGAVRAALPRPRQHGPRLVLSGLDKPTAWSAVEAFGPG